uniref:Wsv137-like protein n=1 Tax=Penaeus monodon endogenous nimavirus TaxID=2133795 RepID=A0A401IPI4_9VIRU|nr:MAG: wsv137-like protein [Penaeus monodon endogenous nimavirus]GBG35511.1 wsv137-like protein [Penaeus monodon endogenous nimavirus]
MNPIGIIGNLQELQVDFVDAADTLCKNFGSHFIPIFSGRTFEDCQSKKTIDLVCGHFQKIVRNIDASSESVLQSTPTVIRLIGAGDTETGSVVLAGLQLEVENVTNDQKSNRRQFLIIHLANALRATMRLTHYRESHQQCMPVRFKSTVSLLPDSKPVSISDPQKVRLTITQALFAYENDDSSDTLENLFSAGGSIWISIDLNDLFTAWTIDMLTVIQEPVTNNNSHQADDLMEDHTSKSSGPTIANIPISELLYTQEAVETISRAFGGDHCNTVPDDGTFSSMKMKCINPNHPDRNPSMIMLLCKSVWKGSRKILSSLTNSSKILLEEEENNPVRYGFRKAEEGSGYLSDGLNNVRIGSCNILLYLVRGYCRSCRHLQILTNKQIMESKLCQ